MTLDTWEVYFMKEDTVEDYDTHDSHLCEKFRRLYILVDIHQKQDNS